MSEINFINYFPQTVSENMKYFENGLDSIDNPVNQPPAPPQKKKQQMTNQIHFSLQSVKLQNSILFQKLAK